MNLGKEPRYTRPRNGGDGGLKGDRKGERGKSVYLKKRQGTGTGIVRK